MHTEVLTKEGREIFNQLHKFRGFYLVGGTALALQLAHRISIDFDLFTSRPLPKNLFGQVKKIFSGKFLHPQVNSLEQLTLTVNDVALTFFYYPFPVLYKPKEYERVKILSIKEVAAMKAYAIGRRAEFKDYVDLYFILAGNHTNLSQVLGLCQKKYGQEFNSRLFLEQLIYLEDIEEVELIFLKKKVTKEEIEEFFKKKIKDLQIKLKR